MLWDNVGTFLRVAGSESQRDGAMKLKERCQRETDRQTDRQMRQRQRETETEIERQRQTERDRKRQSSAVPVGLFPALESAAAGYLIPLLLVSCY